MKQPRYKIYKQVGIHDLVPFKSNVKLFRHLLVAKYTFLYFFYREFINQKFNKLRVNLRRYLHPFITPISRELFSSKKNVRDMKRNVLPIKEKTYTGNIKKYTFKYMSRDIFRKSSFFRKYFRKPHRYFKKRYTKLPKKNALVNSEILNSYFSLFPSSYNLASTLNLNNVSNPMFHFFLIAQKLYLKLTFVNLEKTEVKFDQIKQSQKLNTILAKFLRVFKNTYSRFLKNLINFKNIGNYYLILILVAIKNCLKRVFSKLLNSELVLRLSSLSSSYYYTEQHSKQKKILNELRSKAISDFTDEHYNNIGWFTLMEYFVPKFVQSGYEIFMHKDFVNKLLINPYIYKKYLSELTRSETFIKFSEAIMNYKQKRGMRKFFIYLYRQRYKKIRHKPFHGLGSYYRTTYKIMSYLLNRPIKKYRFYFSSHRLKLFKNKLIKVLYKVKRTKECLEILKKQKVSELSSHTHNSNFLNWHNDLIKFKNLENTYTQITKNHQEFNNKKPLLVGDQIRLVSKSGLPILVEPYELYNFYRTIHFYTNLIPLFDNNSLSLFKSFGKYHFFLDAIKYKLGYIFCKHLYKQNVKSIALKKKKNTIPLKENNKIYYAHISSPYLYFNQRYIFMGEPFDLERANLDEFYRYRFSLYKGRPLPQKTDSLLEFLNFHQYQLPYYMKIYHNRFHVVRYIQFIKGIKNFITMNFNTSQLIGSYSIIITNTEPVSSTHILNAVRNKLHLNKVEELVIGNENYSSIEPQ